MFAEEHICVQCGSTTAKRLWGSETMNDTFESSVPDSTDNERLRRNLVLTWVLLGLICAVFVVPTLRWWWGFGISGEPRAVTPRGELANFEKTTVELFENTSPSVVYVNVSAEVRSPYSRRTQKVEAGAGSGFVWDEAGHIVTNFHVIQNASAAKVVMHDQSSYEADLVGVSPAHDLAVLKIRAPQGAIRPISIGESSTLAVGQSVFAIGNPFGLSHTLTTGIVSAKSRTITSPSNEEIEDVIQIDAAINPGNSGGPLLDSAGRLIGVNTAIVSLSGTSAGVGFAVPVDTVNRVVPQIIEHRRYQPPRLGIAVMRDLSEDVMQRFGIEGVMIANVQEGSGAADAGLRGAKQVGNRLELGDIIQQIDGRAVKSMDELMSAVDAHKVGDVVELKIIRDGKLATARVELR